MRRYAMAMTESELHEAVRTAVVAALGVSEDEASDDATLMDDLGAESIDLLDILFRVERSTGVKIQASDLGDYMQGGIPDYEHRAGYEMITEKGLEHLKTVMPQIDTAALAGSLMANDVIKLCTVSNAGA